MSPVSTASARDHDLAIVATISLADAVPDIAGSGLIRAEPGPGVFLAPVSGIIGLAATAWPLPAAASGSPASCQSSHRSMGQPAPVLPQPPSDAPDRVEAPGR